MNLTELLDHTAQRWPEKPAFIEGDEAVTYARLGLLCAAAAARLESLGIPAGSRIGLCHPNSVRYVALTFALWRIGAVVVPIPVESNGDEVLELAGAMHLQGVLSSQPIGESQPFGPDGFFTRFGPAGTAPENHGLNIAFIRFTSGTTSARKGVVLTHETIRDRVTAANEALGIGPEDTVMWCLPMAHHFLVTIVLYVSVGATVVLARHVLARPFLEAVNRWKGTVLYAAPFHYAMLARDRSELGLSSVRLAVSTTCALPREVADDFFQRFGLPLVQALGIIEVGLACLNTDDPRGRWDSVGRPLRTFQVRIADPDAEGFGDVALTGPGLFDAYAAPWVARAQALPEGWFLTGDIGRLDREGFLFLAGRRTAVINLAGRKVFPEEIEAVINRHPDVSESRVYGRLHPHLGEVVEADVVLARPDADPEGIRAYCREHLAAYKNPARLQVVHALPRTAVTGKIRRGAAVA